MASIHSILLIAAEEPNGEVIESRIKDFLIKKQPTWSGERANKDFTVKFEKTGQTFNDGVFNVTNKVIDALPDRVKKGRVQYQEKIFFSVTTNSDKINLWCLVSIDGSTREHIISSCHCRDDAGVNKVKEFDSAFGTSDFCVPKRSKISDAVRIPEDQFYKNPGEITNNESSSSTNTKH